MWEETAAADLNWWWMDVFSELEEVQLLLNLMLKQMNWGQLPELIRLAGFIQTGNETNFRDFQRMLFACWMERV